MVCNMTVKKLTVHAWCEQHLQLYSIHHSAIIVIETVQLSLKLHYVGLKVALCISKNVLLLHDLRDVSYIIVILSYSLSCKICNIANFRIVLFVTYFGTIYIDPLLCRVNTTGHEFLLRQKFPYNALVYSILIMLF